MREAARRLDEIVSSFHSPQAACISMNFISFHVVAGEMK